MPKTLAVYAASLDPITFGHLWMIEKGQELFDEIHIGIGINPAKAGKYFFSDNERLELSKSCLPNCKVSFMGGLYLVDFAISIGATHILRGIRNTEDFNFESTMAAINREMANSRNFSLETVFLMPPKDLSTVSSSFVKSIIGYNGWKSEIRKYVPENIAQAIESKSYGK